MVLTCKDALVDYYSRFGFVNEGKVISPRMVDRPGIRCVWYFRSLCNMYKQDFVEEEKFGH